MKPRTARPIAPLALVLATLAGCVPEGSAPDGEIGAAPAQSEQLALEAEFVWPAGNSRVTPEGVRVAEPELMPLRVRLRNPGPRPIMVTLDDLVMRPLPPDGAEPEGDDVEAVYPAPPPLGLQPGAERVLHFGEVGLFFGFACTVHLTGEVRLVDGPEGAHAISHDSPPILVEL